MSQDFNKGFGTCFEPVTAEEAETMAQESLRDEEATFDAEHSLTPTPAELEERAAARLRAAREFKLDMELARFIRSAGCTPKPGSWAKTSSPLIKR